MVFFKYKQKIIIKKKGSTYFYVTKRIINDSTFFIGNN